MKCLPEHLTACTDCDQVQRLPAMPSGGRARCVRCGKVFVCPKPGSLERTLALAVAAAVVFLTANLFPVMGLAVAGRETHTTIFGGILQMWVHGERITALLVGLCVLVAPAVQIGLMLIIPLAARHNPAPVWVGRLLLWWEFSRTWSMSEVMLLGMLVALVKIAQLATVIPGIGVFAVGALIFLLAAMTAGFHPSEVWVRITWVEPGKTPDPPDTSNPTEGADSATRLVLCEGCGLVGRVAHTCEPGHCPRCGQELEFRRRDALQRTWALTLAAAICYLPANILPVMTSVTLGTAEPDTIISGVILLYSTGSWDLALIVLIASVVIPLAKLLALVYLLIAVDRGHAVKQYERTRLFRLVKVIGRWSMLDVFVVTFVVALVQLNPLMSVQPGTGVLFFGAVVVLTMFAAESFDSRLIWDARSIREEHS